MKTIATMPGSIADRFGQRTFRASSLEEAARCGILDGFDRGWEAALEAVEALYPDLDMETIERKLEQELGSSKAESKEMYCHPTDRITVHQVASSNEGE